MRGYDSSELFREDALARIKQLDAEIRALQSSMKKLELEAKQAEANFKRLKNKLKIWPPEVYTEIPSFDSLGWSAWATNNWVCVYPHPLSFVGSH